MDTNRKGKIIYCRYIVKNGVKIYPKRKTAFRIFIKDSERR